MHFARRTRPRHPAQMSECLGAGTGCGWCIPFLCRIARAADDPEGLRLDISPEDFAAARRAYQKQGERNEFDPDQDPAGPDVRRPA